VRPVAAIAAGFVADRYSTTRACGVLFALLVAAYVPLSLIAPAGPGIVLAIASMLVTYVAVYALRGVYFALLEDNRTPLRYTGATVGLVSLLGFTPDFFFGPVTGRILDAAPGLPGHQHYFAFLAAVAVAGLVGVAGLLYLHRAGGRPLWPAVKPGGVAPIPPPGADR
jgi:nitrate/nitrite transporter NarK